MSAADGALQQLLRGRGLKLPPQRYVVLSYSSGTPGHCSATQILEQVQHEYPFMTASTVYRTLTMLREAGLVTETDMGTGEAQHEWVAGTPHHHLVCRRCGHTEQVAHQELDDVARQLARNHRFQADLSHLALFGICVACAAAKAAPAPFDRAS
jgi:Fur family ferric uptake transcriptional regulator